MGGNVKFRIVFGRRGSELVAWLMDTEFRIYSPMSKLSIAFNPVTTAVVDRLLAKPRRKSFWPPSMWGAINVLI